jgi:hypothetical protein
MPESSTPRDGVLSYAGEWHALVIGIGAGLEGELDIVVDLALGERDPETPGEQEVSDEPWYAIGAALAAEAVRRMTDD